MTRWFSSKRKQSWTRGCSGLWDEPPRSPTGGQLAASVVKDVRATSAEVVCPPGEADMQCQFDVVSGHAQDLGI